MSVLSVTSKEAILENLSELKKSDQPGVDIKINAVVDCYLRKMAKLVEWQYVGENAKCLEISVEATTVLMDLVRTMEKNVDDQVKLVRNYIDRLEELKLEMEYFTTEEPIEEREKPLLPTQIASKSEECGCCTIS